MTVKNLRRYISLIAVAAVLTALAGCTRNNGSIGSIFGIWRLDELLVDGAEAADYDHNCYWSFQNNIVSFVVEEDPDNHTPLRRWGTFTREDGLLILNLAHTGNGTNDYLYNPPAFLRLPRRDDVALKVLSDNGSKMILSFTADTGEVIQYTLIKQ